MSRERGEAHLATTVALFQFLQRYNVGGLTNGFHAVRDLSLDIAGVIRATVESVDA